MPDFENERFITSIPWSDSRAIVVKLRDFEGGTFLQLRTWNRHRKSGDWYPSRRQVQMPLAIADGLVEGVQQAMMDDRSEKPTWLSEAEDRYDKLGYDQEEGTRGKRHRSAE